MYRNTVIPLLVYGFTINLDDFFLTVIGLIGFNYQSPVGACPSFYTIYSCINEKIC